MNRGTVIDGSVSFAVGVAYPKRRTGTNVCWQGYLSDGDVFGCLVVVRPKVKLSCNVGLIHVRQYVSKERMAVEVLAIWSTSKSLAPMMEIA